MTGHKKPLESGGGGWEGVDMPRAALAGLKPSKAKMLMSSHAFLAGHLG